MSTGPKQPQLSLDELRRLKWLLGGLLALVSLWTVFFLDVEALALVAVASGAIAVSTLFPQIPARLPKLMWRLAVPAIIAVAAVDFYLSPDTLPVLIRLAILLVLYRAMSYRRKREDLQLIVLGLFLIVVAGVLTVSLGFAFLLLLFTACALGFLFVITLIDMSEPPGPVGEPEREVPAWARLKWARLLRQLRRVFDWRLVTFSALLFTLVVGFSGVLFLIIPRFELATGFFLDKYITRKSRTGFSETVRFGDVSELVRDDSIALRVDLSGATSMPPESTYWRLVVMDEYTPQGFRISASLKSELLASQSVRQDVRSAAGTRDWDDVWTVYVEPGVSRFLPLPGRFSRMRMRDRLPVQTSATTLMVALRTEPMTMTAFQIYGVDTDAPIREASLPGRIADALHDSPGRPGPLAQRFADPLMLLGRPAGAENEETLARIIGEITGGQSLSAGEFVERATAWIRARHPYALSARIPRGSRDDIVKWLDSNEPGFCEYFASGLAVLCRTAGFPARVAAGFNGGTLNAFENYLMVKNSNAHAWCEVFDGTDTWIRVDPTPGGSTTGRAGAAQAARQEQDSSWSARIDSLRVIWYRRIVNFDSRTQVEMIEQVKTITTGTGQRFRAWLDEQTNRIKQWFSAPWDTRRAMRWIGVGLAAVAFVWSGSRILRWLWWRWQVARQPGEFDPIRREAGRRLAQLRAKGERRPGVLDGAMNAVIEDLVRLRYGHRETWPDPTGVFRRARLAARR